MQRIFGPPGTGKTTRLLDMVDKAIMDGINPHAIAFLAFTRKAATEAKERAAERFKLEVNHDLYYFRTLHSLSFRLLNLKKEDLIQAEHYKELADKIGFTLNATQSPLSDDEDAPATCEHPILSLLNLSRLKKTPLQAEYNASHIGFTWQEVDYVASCYNEFKTNNGICDYTDMLELFVQDADRLCPNFDIVFLDEAQDLSPLQWDVADALNRKSKKMYIAGDDDQAIYRFAGADVNHFINLPCSSEVLEQSYRIPGKVHNLAQKIVSRIGNRYPKIYKPRQEAGEILHYQDTTDLFSRVNMSSGSWLIMAQANYMLSPLAQELRNAGYLFERNGKRSISTKLAIAVNSWERLRKGKKIEKASARIMYAYMTGSGHRVARGKKKIKGEDTELVSFETLTEEHGLLATMDMVWHTALDQINDTDRVYITSLLRRGEKFNATPRIRLSTIHGTKGGEADNVVLFTDLTSAALATYGDDLHRVFYVAVTRTKENLHIVEPEDYLRAYDLP